jgi:hypothetical protein
LLCAAILVGCSLDGSWRVIATDPPGARAPVSVVTFGQDHNYTATWSHEGETRTSLGRYRRRGAGLEMTGVGELPQPNSARLRLDGKLVLTYLEGDTKVVATLEKVGD